MLEQINTFADSVCNIVEYCNCSALEYIAQQLIMDRYVISTNYTSSVSTVKGLKDRLSISNTLPLQGERWLIVVDVDKIGVSDAIKYMDTITSTATLIYVTHNYRSYRTMTDSKAYKQQSATNFAKQLYLGKLNGATIDLLYDFYTRKSVDNKSLGYEISSKLMHYIKKNYCFNPDLVCDLFSKIKDGEKPSTEKDVIELVGVGGNTPQAVTISLLTTSTHTTEGKRRFLKRTLMLFNDLSVKFSYDTTYNYMISTLKGIIDIKELQISGKYTSFYKDIPSTFSDERVKRMSRLQRFEDIILDKISLRRALILLQCMTSNEYNKQQVILNGVYKYASRLGVS